MNIFDAMLGLVILFIASFGAFSALIAGFERNISISAARGGHMKHTGASALVWGILFFISLMFFPVLIFLSFDYKLQICITTAIGFICALKVRPFSRK
ncbi:MAG: hypothetical protein ABIO02_00090 [Patescibacteria group bacterium]